MKNRWQQALQLIRQHRAEYVALNLLYYGLILVGTTVVLFVPDLQQLLLKNARHGLETGILSGVKSAYAQGHLTSAIGLTFVINLVGGSFLEITLPSLLLPFSGVLVGLGRAALWGLVLAPVDPHLRWVMIPHSLTLLVEGQAYVLAMFAACRLGVGLFQPRSISLRTHWEGYRAGLRQTWSLYSLIVALLAVAAVYEAIEVIYIAPLMGKV